MSATEDAAKVIAEELRTWTLPANAVAARCSESLAEALAVAGLLRDGNTVTEWASAVADDMKPGPVLSEQVARAQVTGWNSYANVVATSPLRAVLLHRTVGEWTEVES